MASSVLYLRVLLYSWTILTLLAICSATYEDARCKCVCIDETGTQNGTKPTRKVYVRAISADKCTCNIMLEKEAALCPYCDCKYQVRNTTTIKVVVCLIVAVISALTLYMIFLMLLEPLLSARRKTAADVNLPASSLSTGVSKFAGRIDWSSGLPGQAERAYDSAAASASGDQLSFESPFTTSKTVVHWNRAHVENAPAQDLAAAGDLPDLGLTRQRFGRSEPLYNTNSSSLGASGASVSEVVNRALNQQKRWKGNVEAQRARVFREHTLLN